MSAEVVKVITVSRRYRAWCEDCQDGYQGGKKTAEKWADTHNAERHMVSPTT